MAEGAQRDKVEASKQKNAKAVLDKIIELEKSMAQEDANHEQGIQDTIGPTEGKIQENEEVLGGGGQEQSPVWDNPENHPSTSNNILTGGHVPIAEMGLIVLPHLNNTMWHAWRIFVSILK